MFLQISHLPFVVLNWLCIVYYHPFRTIDWKTQLSPIIENQTECCLPQVTMTTVCTYRLTAYSRLKQLVAEIRYVQTNSLLSPQVAESFNQSKTPTKNR